MSTQVDLEIINGTAKVSVIGEITQKTVFPTLSREQCQVVDISLRGMTYVNSAGIQKWLFWSTQLSKTFGSSIILTDLAPGFVRQASSIKGLLPKGAKIQSFIVPYFCNNCQNPTKEIFTKGQNWDPSWGPAELVPKMAATTCPTCGSVAEIDGPPDMYVNLLR